MLSRRLLERRGGCASEPPWWLGQQSKNGFAAYAGLLTAARTTKALPRRC
jgi:hypothetical protein